MRRSKLGVPLCLGSWEADTILLCLTGLLCQRLAEWDGDLSGSKDQYLDRIHHSLFAKIASLCCSVLRSIAKDALPTCSV
jgi:hypothetical protein